MTRVAVVTGGNRGLGLETSRQLAAQGWTVVLTARNLEKAQVAAESIDGAVFPDALDVTSTAQAEALAAHVRERFGRIDAIINNAAILGPSDRAGVRAAPGDLLATIDNNDLGAWRVTVAFLDLLVASRGVVVNVSSGMGGIAEMNGGSPGYRLSKAALNAVTRILHAELHPRGVRVNSVCPGWVRTEMGGPRATRELPDGARGIVWAATLPPDGPSGGFFRDGQPIAF